MRALKPRPPPNLTRSVNGWRRAGGTGRLGEQRMALFEPHDWLTTKLVTFIANLTPRCREVTRLLSQGMDRPLPLRTRVALRLHFTVCDYCLRYAKQLRFLRQVSQALPQRGVGRSSVTLPETTKARLRQALRAERPPDNATK